MTVTDRSAIEGHRTFELAPIRGADACIAGPWLELDQYAERAQLVLHVGRDGRARLESANVTRLYLSPLEPSPRCLQQLQTAISHWRYRPFLRHGVPSSARIEERVLLISAERWRHPRQPFPEIDDIAKVRITLRRSEDLHPCQGGRNPNYELELRGDGQMKLTEFARFGRIANERIGRIDIGAFQDLVEQFRAADFFSLQDEYRSDWSHQTTQTLFVEIGDQSLRVRDYVGETVGMPLIVRELQDAVDRVAGLPPLSCTPRDFQIDILEREE